MLEPKCINKTLCVCVCVCVCVGVSLRNDFLRNNGAIQAKSPTTKRYTQVLNQRNAKVSQI